MSARKRERPENDDLYEFGLDLPKRRVYLDGDIDRELVLKVIKGLSVLNRLSGEDPIQLVINSEGGDTVQSFALIDYMNSISNPIEGIVLGTCESAALVILQACKFRKAMVNSTLMTHRGERSSQFDAQVDERADILIATRIGWSKSKLDRFHAYDRYMFSDEALELGFIDEIIQEVQK